MQHVIALPLTTTRRWRGMLLGALIAAITGATAGYLRPALRGTVHYEMIASLFVVVPVICLCLTLSLRQVPWRQAAGWLVLETSAVCAAFAIAWAAVFRHLVQDMLSVMTVVWLVAAASSVALLILWQQLHRPHSGPYCPGCRYCLIGVPTDRCPECGRDFTLQELGITREALQPPSPG
jgi:hypothetical protein